MNRVLLKAAVLSISLLLLAATAVSPAIANISAAFKQVSAQTIMLLVSLPSMTMVLASLVFGKLSESMSRRTLFHVAMLLFLIGGITPYFMNDITMILVMRAILGLSLGLIFPLSLVLISDFFEGGERATIMGLQSVCVNIGGIIFSLLGGLLCVADWHNTFLAYAFGFLVLIFVYFYLPEPPKPQVTANQGDAAKTPLPGKVYFIESVVFLYNLLIFVFFTNVAIQVVGENMGNAASAGIALTMFTGGGLVGGLLFGKAMQLLKNYTIAVGWLLTGAGMALIAGTHDFTLLLTGCFIGGIGFSTTCPAFFVTLSVLSPPARVAFSIALASALSGIGQFVAPFVFEVVSGQFGQGPGRFPLFVSAVSFVAVGVLLLLQNYTQSPSSAKLNS
ncbi:MFS transporter [Sporomusa malonica]|uniref:Predicted arabinose efflux permease, MFS family n=1 Tax=Sporomusa malonica TaxID=112901 RepID=A0A1W2EXY7_9FIRM|nr:MFS transporter [Sporomusa malonica]SMD14559.1 Predicted arabinose efflux permease, MFS family [Sporomusa malonica]